MRTLGTIMLAKAEGKRDRAAGKVQNKWGKAKDEVRDVVR
jgi:uncharacterized protein YjbJ (UPF0337 family)